MLLADKNSLSFKSNTMSPALLSMINSKEQKTLQVPIQIPDSTQEEEKTATNKNTKAIVILGIASAAALIATFALRGKLDKVAPSVTNTKISSQPNDKTQNTVQSATEKVGDIIETAIKKKDNVAQVEPKSPPTQKETITIVQKPAQSEIPQVQKPVKKRVVRTSYTTPEERGFKRREKINLARQQALKERYENLSKSFMEARTKFQSTFSLEDEKNLYLEEIKMIEAELEYKKSINAKIDALQEKLAQAKQSLLAIEEKIKTNAANKTRQTTSVQIEKNSTIQSHRDLIGKNPYIRADLIKKGTSADLEKYDMEFKSLLPLEAETRAYRGRIKNPVRPNYNADYEVIEKANVGDIITPDTAYSRLYLDKTKALKYAKGKKNEAMLYEIILPKGSKVSRSLDEGGEFVMPRSAKYKLISKSKDSNNILNVVLEFIQGS